jgi:hypothetical protein
MDPVGDVRKRLDKPPTIEHMDTPADPDTAVRLAAIRATAGSADDIFAPGCLERLRHDWPD